MYRRSSSEPIVFSRDCSAIAVPEGVAVDLPKGSAGSIVQALGGSFTVLIRGRLFRIDGDDADAIGKQPPPRPTLCADASAAEFEEAVYEQLRSCFDPEIPVNVVDLGLVYGCRVEQRDDGSREVFIDMTLTEPSCGMGDVLAQDVKGRVGLLPTVANVHVAFVFEPRWTWERASEVARLEMGM